MTTEEPETQIEREEDVRPPFAEHNVVAAYPSPEAARDVIRRLEMAGVEAGDVSLLGPGSEPAEDPETNVEQQEADVQMTHDVGKRMVVGGALGTTAGAALGGLLGAAAFAVPGIGTVVGAGLLAGIFGGGAAGGALGVFYGGATGLPVNNEAWGLTYESLKGGRTLIAVHSDDPTSIDRAVATLRKTDPERLAVFGPDGKLADVH